MLTMKKSQPNSEQKIVDSIRTLGIDMIDHAKSGHPGIVLGAAPVLYTLYAKHLKFNPEVPDWISRDRFIMSAGHGSALLYATLFFSGFSITIDDLKKFRKIGSITPGHPEYGVTEGVDMSTGPLGQGFASSVGMAIAERYLANYYNKKQENLIDYYTFVLCGDGDLMEGISYEAASLAGTLQLHKLIVLYDSNNISLDGKTDMTFQDNIEGRFTSLGWNVISGVNGEDLQAIDKAITKAKTCLDKPTLIEIKTTIGKYSKWQGTNQVHGTPLEKEDIAAMKKKMHLRDIPFTVSKDAMKDMQKMIHTRLDGVYKEWEDLKNNLTKEEKEELESLITKDHSFKMTEISYQSPHDLKEATRTTSGKILNEIAKQDPFLIGGSADLSTSTKTYLEGMGDFGRGNYLGRNIWFGVREHAMGAILNGLALSGLHPFGSTFLTFSDYLKPAIRMSALMNLKVTYIFTHDSVSVGEDGPTHQPVEQLISLRSIPNLEVFRPADANEVIGVYKTIAEKPSGPSAIILGRNSVKIIETTNVTEVEKGAYIVRKEEKNLSCVLIATGEEVNLALMVADRLQEKGIDLRVVSMPSIERFLNMPKDYQEKLLPKEAKVIVLEASSSYSWHQFVYSEKYLINVNSFGLSGKKDDVMKKFGFDFESVLEQIEERLK